MDGIAVRVEYRVAARVENVVSQLELTGRNVDLRDPYRRSGRSRRFAAAGEIVVPILTIGVLPSRSRLPCGGAIALWSLTVRVGVFPSRSRLP